MRRGKTKCSQTEAGGSKLPSCVAESQKASPSSLRSMEFHVKEKSHQGWGRTDMLGGTGGSAWNNFSRNIQGQVPAQPCALPAPQSWLNFQWMIFMALKTSEQGFCISREPNAEGHHLLQVGETGVGMGQDLILRLQPHPCADTSQPLHLCRCLSPFLVPKLISNSLLNHFEKLLCK